MTKLKDQVIAECVRDFEHSVLKHNEYSFEDSDIANRHYHASIKALKQLYRFGDKGLSALATLLDHKEAVVRVTAACYLINRYTDKSIKVLTEASGADPVRGLALVTLRRWDLNRLLETMTPLSKRLLDEFRDFLPYGAFMKLDGTIVDCAVSGEEEHPPSKELIQTLTLDFQKRAAKGEIRAAGICCDVKVATPEYPEKTDAVQFALEHQNGESVNVFLSYDLDSSGEVKYGGLFATAREREFFKL